MAADSKGSENLAERYAAALLELADEKSKVDAVAATTSQASSKSASKAENKKKSPPKDQGSLF